MALSERKKKILRAVVENYIETAEPVGSKLLAKELGLDVSSATIRNEMAELESLGYLEQPHTSAGRVPSPLGYRMYVNELMEQHRLSLEETETINNSLNHRLTQLDRLVADAGQVISKLTEYPAYALRATVSQVVITRYDLIFVDSNTFIIVVMLSNNSVKNKLVHLHAPIQPEMLTKLAAVFNASFTGIPDEEMTQVLISSTERATGDNSGLAAIIAAFSIETLMSAKESQAYLTGTSHLLLQPEYKDVNKAQKILKYLSDGSELLKLPEPDSGNIKIMIGPENVADELKDSSVVVAKYDAGDNAYGLIGVVGPTRMDYSKVAAHLSYIAGGLSRMLAGGELNAAPAVPPQLDAGHGDDND